MSEYSRRRHRDPDWTGQSVVPCKLALCDHRHSPPPLVRTANPQTAGRGVERPTVSAPQAPWRSTRLCLGVVSDPARSDSTRQSAAVVTDLKCLDDIVAYPRDLMGEVRGDQGCTLAGYPPDNTTGQRKSGIQAPLVVRGYGSGHVPLPAT